MTYAISCKHSCWGLTRNKCVHALDVAAVWCIRQTSLHGQMYDRKEFVYCTVHMRMSGLGTATFLGEILAEVHPAPSAPLSLLPCFSRLALSCLVRRLRT
jgi:hypothetical protein